MCTQEHTRGAGLLLLLSRNPPYVSMPPIALRVRIPQPFVCALISDPTQFDVVVTPNMFGDFISEALSMLPRPLTKRKGDKCDGGEGVSGGERGGSGWLAVVGCV